MIDGEEFERQAKAKKAVSDKHANILRECLDFEPPLGWLKLVDNALTRIKNVDPGARVVQVKSKFAGLEIYTEGVTYSHRVDDIIAQLTVKATKTCEDCGEPGEHLIKCGCEAILCKACSDD